jgi:hypothetical protein
MRGMQEFREKLNMSVDRMWLQARDSALCALALLSSLAFMNHFFV